MLSHLARIAQVEGRETVRINFVPTPRNKPAREFLESIGAIIEAEDGIACQIDFESGRVAELSSPLHGKHGVAGSLPKEAPDAIHQV